MSFHGLTREKIERAWKHNPGGVRRLAAFVGAEGVGVFAVLRACERHRAAQNLAPTRSRLIVNDRRAR